MLDYHKIGNRIALLRREKGLTGEKLADLAGVSPQAVSKWENGKNLPETQLLPSLSQALGVSIDSLLIPKELVLLSGVYTDGVTEMDVTRTLEGRINGNRLYLTCTPQFLGCSLEGGRVKLLTIKYQTPEGLYYDYILQDQDLNLDLCARGRQIHAPFEIIGAYYGNAKNIKNALSRIEHYDYFNWKQIHVNHESFPSSPGTDEDEYLTLVYLNASGIHTISCPEGGVIGFSQDGTDMFLKDTSSLILPGIRTLEWEKGMDCTWAGALFAALSYMGEAYTYEEIMGMSGACYRLAFTEVWDWSATDALVAFDYSAPLFRAIGYEQLWADRVTKDSRPGERQRILKDLEAGKPVVAINLRIAPEWGVITGYGEKGKVFYCRTYFDKAVLEKNKDLEYLETDFWPFLIVHFGEKKEAPHSKAILVSSLKLLTASFLASPNRGYYQGRKAYEKWIEGLKEDKLWCCPRNQEGAAKDIERRTAVNDSMLLNLIDARRSASVYLRQCASLLTEEQGVRLSKLGDVFALIAEKLTAHRLELKAAEGSVLKYNAIEIKNTFPDALRYKEAELLTEVLQLEEEAFGLAGNLLSSEEASEI